MSTAVSPLSKKIEATRLNQKQRGPVQRTTRKPTGKPPWPLILVAGAEKSGKSYSAAVASASPLIGRTFWIGVGEDDPDEYGAIEGARFEIVEHDGTYFDIAQAIDWAAAQPQENGLPNLIVIDSGSRLWSMLCDEAQILANARYKNTNPDAEAPINMDLWNRATGRWEGIMGLLRSHKGPVIITARLETVTVMDDDGKPTKDKHSKVKGQKGLPFDVGVVVEMPRRGEAYLTGARSLRMNVSVEEKQMIRDFKMEKLWQDLGVTGDGATSPRQHSEADGAKSIWIAKFNYAKHDTELLCALRDEAVAAGLPEDHGMFHAIEAELVALKEAPAKNEAV